MGHSLGDFTGDIIKMRRTTPNYGAQTNHRVIILLPAIF